MTPIGHCSPIDDTPVFEVRHLDGRCWRIWADGRIDGFDGQITINRIPSHTAEAVMRERERHLSAA